MSVQLRDHVTTDPACRLHVYPTTWLARRRYEKARGVGCPHCVPALTLAQENHIAIREELALLRAMELVRRRQLTSQDVPSLRGGQPGYAQGYRHALADVLRDLGLSTNGAYLSAPTTPEQEF